MCALLLQLTGFFRVGGVCLFDSPAGHLYSAADVLVTHGFRLSLLERCPEIEELCADRLGDDRLERLDDLVLNLA